MASGVNYDLVHMLEDNARKRTAKQKRDELARLKAEARDRMVAWCKAEQKRIREEETYDLGGMTEDERAAYREYCEQQARCRPRSSHFGGNVARGPDGS